MRSGNRSNALLVELLIVIMFFMLASTILLRVFTSARMQSFRAEMETLTLAEAQNVADQLYITDDPDALLGSLGFVKTDDLWVLNTENYQMEAAVNEETDEYGVFRRQEVRVILGDETLFTLPCSRWQGVTE